jgi:tetratricopeptide (TPR) repeat protein
MVGAAFGKSAIRNPQFAIRNPQSEIRNRVAAMEPFEFDDLALKARAALDGEQYVRALAMIDQLLAADPDKPTLHFWRSRALLGQGDPAEALQAARQAVKLDPYLVEAYYPLAWAAAGVNRKQEGQEAFERALAVTGRDAAWLVEYATFLASERGPKVAEEIAREAVAARPDRADAWAALGFAQYRMHQTREAEESFREALAREPDNPRAMVYMAELLNRTGRPERAAALAGLLKDNPDAADVAGRLQREAMKHMRMFAPAGQGGEAPPPQPAPQPEPSFDGREFARTFLRATGWLVGVGVVGACMILAAVSGGRRLHTGLLFAGLTLIGLMVMTRQR